MYTWTQPRRPALIIALLGALGAGAGPLGVTAQGADKGPVFLAGAASADITPPPWTAASDAAFVPACGPSADAVSTLWPGERRLPGDGVGSGGGP